MGQRAYALNLLRLCCLGALLFFATAMQAQEDAEQTPEDVEEFNEDFLAPVVIDGVELFVVRGTSVLPAEERALKIEERIVALAELPANIPIQFETNPNAFGLEIVANGRTIAVTTEADAELEQVGLDVLATLHVEAMQQAIAAYRADRTEEARVDSVFSAIAFTTGFATLTFLFLRYRRRSAFGLAAMVERRFIGVETATQAVVQGHAVGRMAGFMLHAFLWVSFLFLLYYYLSFVLLSFAETRPFAQLLLTYVSEPLVTVLLGIFGYLPNLITLIIIAIVTRYIVRGFRIFMDNVAAGTFDWPDFEPHWVKPTFNIGRFVIIAIAIVFAYPYLPGSGSTAFQGLTILAGIMVSLGSNSVVSNIMAGLFVLYRRSTNVGDRIRIGDQVGDVVEIKLMETLIKSVKNEMVSIPNTTLLNSEVVNYSQKIDGRGLLVHTTVGIGYEIPQDKIEAMLIEAADRTEGLKKTPRPFVLWTALADFAINYQINAFTSRGSSMLQLQSDLNRNIIDVFTENNVQIMTPTYEGDPAEPKIATESWDGALASTKTSTD